jgi:hypothetical protein
VRRQRAANKYLIMNGNGISAGLEINRSRREAHRSGILTGASRHFDADGMALDAFPQYWFIRFVEVGVLPMVPVARSVYVCASLIG